MLRLLTLGSLGWTGQPFGREKPLLLLAYLSLNGTQLRRDVAQRFWPDASNPMNSLSVALGQLRKAAPDAINASEAQVGTDISCDALDFRDALSRHDLNTARTLYRGAFLAWLTLDDLGEELEEWVMHTREELAAGYRELLIHCARAELAARPAEAGELAATAYVVAGAAPSTPGELRELHRILWHAGHPDAGKIAREAAELGVTLQTGQAQPSTPLLGRGVELERLHALQAGETLWLRGACGLGKTALLRALSMQGGTLLSGRSGQAFQTLLALEPDPVPQTEIGWLRLVTDFPSSLLLDDWEAADPESRRVLLALARSKAGRPLVIASRERPPVSLTELTLRPIDQTHLKESDWQRSAGIPALLKAETDANLAESYANLLSHLTPRARQLLACLAVQDKPNRQATSKALSLSADDMAELLETLARACLLDGIRPLAPQAIRAWLDTQPSLETEVLTLLAPYLDAETALPLYLRAHELTGSSDFEGFQDVLEKHCRTLLEKGQDSEAEVLLSKHALTETNRLLRGRALDALGRYPEAMKLLDELEKTPLVEAYRGRVLFRLGKPDKAEKAAQQALKGDLEAKAQGHNLLGVLALASSDYATARKHHEKGNGLFLLLDSNIGRIHSLCNLAVSMSKLGDNTDEIVSLIIELSENLNHPPTMLNVGWLLESRGDLNNALTFASRGAVRAEEIGQSATAARAWNNVGVLQHKLGRLSEASRAYQHAIGLARQTKEIRTLATSLGNLAELQESLPLIEEALVLLKDAGQDDLVAYFEELQASFRGRSGAE